MRIKKTIISMALSVVLTTTTVGWVSAATYKPFDTTFHYASNGGSGTNVLTQTVDVVSRGYYQVKAKCTTFNYSGSNPSITITSADAQWPSTTVSFSDTYNGNYKTMQYTNSLPTSGKIALFRGTLHKPSSNATSATVACKVQTKAD